MKLNEILDPYATLERMCHESKINTNQLIKMSRTVRVADWGSLNLEIPNDEEVKLGNPVVFPNFWISTSPQRAKQLFVTGYRAVIKPEYKERALKLSKRQTSLMHQVRDVWKKIHGHS